MSTNLKYLLFGFMMLVQIGVPGYLITSRESILHEGERMLFRAKPVDPYDAFRGRYLWLGFEEDKIPAKQDERWEFGQIAFVILEKDATGFEKAVSLSRKRPVGNRYVKVQTTSGVYEGSVRIEYPFRQYFLSEKKAPKAESLYREHSSQEKREAYVAVRVKDGLAVLENLFIAGKPISEYF